jgi:hypothetical protein
VPDPVLPSPRSSTYTPIVFGPVSGSKTMSSVEPVSERAESSGSFEPESVTAKSSGLVPESDVPVSESAESVAFESLFAESAVLSASANFPVSWTVPESVPESRAEDAAAQPTKVFKRAKPKMVHKHLMRRILHMLINLSTLDSGSGRLTLESASTGAVKAPNF